jgi:hypothetical protein
MSKELVKRIAAALERSQPRPVLSPALTARQPEIVQPEIWRPRRAGLTSFASGSTARVDHPPVIELQRYCAVYDREMWLARYIWNGPRYEFNTSIELTGQQQIRYAPENIITLPVDFETDIERCACCGTWTPQDSSGSIQCHNGSPHYACFGRTSLRGYFRCRASCGGYGQLYDGPAPKFGLTPGRGRMNSGTQF